MRDETLPRNASENNAVQHQESEEYLRQENGRSRQQKPLPIPLVRLFVFPPNFPQLKVAVSDYNLKVVIAKLWLCLS